MTAIRKIIAQLEIQDELQEEKNEKDSAEQLNIYEDMKNRINYVEDKSTEHMNSLIKGMNQLAANRHTIEEALRMEGTFTGLPIPHEHRKISVDLVSKAIEFINKLGFSRGKNILYPGKIHQTLVNTVESVATDFRECQIEVAQALQLYDNVLLLK